MSADRYFVKTLGCKANLQDSQLIESELQRRGWYPAEHEDHPDIRLFVVNSCTVTDQADRQSRKAAERAGKRLTHAHVLFTGCSAEADPKALRSLRGVDSVVGNRDKARLVELALGQIAASNARPGESEAPEILGSAVGYEELLSRHPADREWPLPQKAFDLPRIANSRRTRAFLKVQEGCDSFCTYCIIPYGRGPSRSLAIDEVIARVQELVEGGTKEIVLTGTNLGDYGRDPQGRPAIEELCSAILSRTALARLRLTSLDPTEISDRLITLLEQGSPRFSPHFHVSLQSPHTRILKLMKRRYGAEETAYCLRAIEAAERRMGRPIFVGMDVITGFPGETLEEFEWGVAALRDLPWSRLHVFPYSERSHTPATRLPGSVPGAERKRRARVLIDLSLERQEAFSRRCLDWANARPAGLEAILLEGGAIRGPDGTEGWMAGHSPEYLRVVFPLRGREPSVLRNQTVAVKPKTLFIDRPASDVTLVSELLS